MLSNLLVSIAGHEDRVYRLHKALYGLKQAPRAWYNRIETHFLQNEPTLYVKSCGNRNKLIYVDDFPVIGNDIHEIDKFKKSMLQVFKMIDLGEMRYLFGMEVHQSSDGIFLSQRKYAKDMLRKFKLESCNPVSTPLAVNESSPRLMVMQRQM